MALLIYLQTLSTYCVSGFMLFDQSQTRVIYFVSLLHLFIFLYSGTVCQFVFYNLETLEEYEKSVL
jgi:hypothetical protein